MGAHLFVVADSLAFHGPERIEQPTDDRGENGNGGDQDRGHRTGESNLGVVQSAEG